MPPKHGNQEFYDNTEKCTAETILADLPTSGPFTLVFRSQCMVYLLEDLQHARKFPFSLISFLSFFFSARKLLLLEEVWTILHATPTPSQTPSLFPPWSPPSQNQESLLLAKCRSPSNVFARFRLSRRHIFLQVPELEILIFAREPVSRNWWNCKKKALT